MQLKTILNRVERHKSFVYGDGRWLEGERLAIEVPIEPRANGRPICSGCGKPRPGYDRQPARRFEFVPLWQVQVFFIYALRRVDCPRCGVKVERFPKRHIAVDTLGLVWAVVVHGAYWQDHDGACFVFQKLRAFGRLRVVFADSAYGRNDLPAWVKETFGWVLQTVLRPVKAKGFVVLPKRWIVERTFAWLARCRRHSKDYEHNPETSEAMIQISMIALMSRRLAG